MEVFSNFPRKVLKRACSPPSYPGSRRSLLLKAILSAKCKVHVQINNSWKFDQAVVIFKDFMKVYICFKKRASILLAPCTGRIWRNTGREEGYPSPPPSPLYRTTKESTAKWKVRKICFQQYIKKPSALTYVICDVSRLRLGLRLGLGSAGFRRFRRIWNPPAKRKRFAWRLHSCRGWQG